MGAYCASTFGSSICSDIIAQIGKIVKGNQSRFPPKYALFTIFVSFAQFEHSIFGYLYSGLSPFLTAKIKDSRYFFTASYNRPPDSYTADPGIPPNDFFGQFWTIIYLSTFLCKSILSFWPCAIRRGKDPLVQAAPAEPERSITMFIDFSWAFYYNLIIKSEGKRGILWISKRYCRA